jgi:membrane-bound serine protease (ClpP class)
VNASSVRLRTRFRVSLAAIAAVAAIAITAMAQVSLAGSPPDSVHADAQPSRSVAVADAGTVSAADAKSATVLEINGAIGPATSRYVTKGLETARLNGSCIVVLQIDTPGGLDSSMRDIIRAILASPIPVVSYVSPSGARAASAGTYILYASHIAAMAPATNLGAATPVSIGGGDEHGSGRPDEGAGGKLPTTSPEQSPGQTPSQSPGKSGESSGQPPKQPEATSSESPMERKILNDAVAYIRGLAELRGRNADWAEQAVRGAASLSASAALKQNVIDVVARDLPDLLSQIDGREVRVGNNVMKLATRDLGITNLKPDWRVELLSVITNPTIAYGLLLIGIYGLLFEGYNPGAVFPGVVGAIALLIALFAFQILSVNYAGLALVAVGVGMIIAEFFFPTFGSLGLGGLIAFIVGSLILFDTDIPGMNIGLPVIAAVATVGGLAILAMAWLASRSLRRPVVTGVQTMVGENAEVLDAFNGRGRVRYGGEIWNAVSSSAVRAGQIVRITGIDGLTVWVEPV